MGFESFQIELRGGRTNFSEVTEFVRKLPNVKADEGLLDGAYFVMDDGQHAIEVEVNDFVPLRVSCRFILSHPPSIDGVFLNFVRVLMTELGMKAKICNDVRPDHDHPFYFDQFNELSASASLYIAARRKEWIATMGPEQATNRKELYERIILPQCEPIVEPVVHS